MNILSLKSIHKTKFYRKINLIFSFDIRVTYWVLIFVQFL